MIGLDVLRPTFAQIDLDTLKENYRTIRDFVGHAKGTSPAVIAVVKANAYGHGLVSVAQALEEAGATQLACADIEEGVELREGGIRIPILVFGALGVSDVNGIFDYNLTPTVSSPSAARALQTVASTRAVPLHCHLKIDTGMNRFGFRHDNLRTMIPEVLNSPHLVFDAVYTHFATAEDPAHPLFAEQCARFSASAQMLVAAGFGNIGRHAANSAALLTTQECWYDAVRPGLLLYGVVPLGVDVPRPLHLRPVMSLRSRIVSVKGMRVGETSGYGAQFTAQRPTRVAIVPAGYADGLDVRLSGVGQVLVRGRRMPIVGSVCMDSITIDVTGVEVETGDEVVVIGAQDGDQIDVAQVARWIGTVPHDVLCRTGSRIERIYKSGNQS